MTFPLQEKCVSLNRAIGAGHRRREENAKDLFFWSSLNQDTGFSVFILALLKSTFYFTSFFLQPMAGRHTLPVPMKIPEPDNGKGAG